MTPTFKNLKNVVRKSYEPEPYARYVVRHISILFTWVFVRTPLSANQVTLIQEFIGVVGCILLGFGIPFYGLLGVFFLQLGYILDCTDGEVARWKHQQSISGVFLDLVGHMIVIPSYLFALGFGVWMQSGRIEPLICGFIAALFGIRIEKHTLSAVVDSLITETEKPQYNFTALSKKVNELDEKIEWGSAGSIGRRSFIQVLFRYPDSMNVVTLIVLIDYFFKGLLFNGTNYSFSYFLIMIYGMVLLLGRLIQIRNVFKNNLVEKRFLNIIKLAIKITK